MSAWFVLSALGFYPICPGKPEYTLGSPLFSRAVVRLPGGITFTIEAKGNTPDTVYVRRATLEGKPLPGNTLNHAAIVRGGTLLFEMASQPGTSQKAGTSA
jgi:putative alpha-1,2-mannosidase